VALEERQFPLGHDTRQTNRFGHGRRLLTMVCRASNQGPHGRFNRGSARRAAGTPVGHPATLAGPAVDRAGFGGLPGELAVAAGGRAVGQLNSHGRCLMPLMKLDSR
jgi:hypothetical protein